MDAVSEIKQKLDIVDIVSGYVPLKKSGKNYKGVCPFHSENTPSFMVSPELQIFKCFGCGEAGDIFAFIKKIEGVEFSEALKILADRADVKLEEFKNAKPSNKNLIYKINELTASFYTYLLTEHKAGAKARDYLKTKRKLNQDTLKIFRVGYAPEKWDLLFTFLTKKGYTPQQLDLAGVIIKSQRGNYIDKFRGRIIFPLIDVSGKIVGFTGRDIAGHDPKYLNSPETEVFDKSSFLYGLNLAKVEIKKQGAILVEGQVDVLKAYQNSIKNVVATSGTSLAEKHLKLLSRYTNQITFCFDPDEAGQKASERAIELAEKFLFDIKIAPVPKNYADLDELINADVSLAKSILAQAVPIYDFYLSRAFSLFDKRKAYDKKKILEYFLPKLKITKSQVIKEHYIKLLSSELSLEEATLQDMLKSAKIEDRILQESASAQEIRIDLERRLFELLLKCDLDTMGHFLYKLEANDLLDVDLQRLLVSLKAYLNSQPSQFDIKFFQSDVAADLQDLVAELYLAEKTDFVAGSKVFDSEIKTTFSRVKKDALKRELKILKEQTKLAEMQNDQEKLQDLVQKINELTKNLLNYD